MCSGKEKSQEIKEKKLQEKRGMKRGGIFWVLNSSSPPRAKERSRNSGEERESKTKMPLLMHARFHAVFKKKIRNREAFQIFLALFVLPA